MARIRCDFFSETLGLSTSMTVLLPERAATQIGMSGSTRTGDPPVLYLLHGLSDDDTTWLRRTSVERYVAPLGLAVVMPQVARSLYADQEYGSQYWTFLSQELPKVCHSFFRLSRRRADTFVAGLSMGGYGALKWALQQPGRFAAAASLSGALDLASRHRHPQRPLDPATWHAAFGDRTVRGTDDDLLTLLDRATSVPTRSRPDTGNTDGAGHGAGAASGAGAEAGRGAGAGSVAGAGSDGDRADGDGGLPALWIGCGTGDFLYDDNVRFADALQRAGVPATVDFSSGGHDWEYWDRAIRDVLAWLPLAPTTD
ncbi:alpha/beta hydrolase [Micromonospora yangpuensis]|uniref:S-formylglutathione hydrolase FrmB n=1 Tax=Micromonospora yangpuensis TaxID=683228 RepID=A0A1C6UUH3_9ACTN|nr:alpha/beta hydrolase family protein [Micromonospora yangpuensis]GGM24053.1 hypothetical protein GCM10012279_48020 [Micromonospora yangpuensis]SCL57692.1 S-formylglutathione hydrolase FrmB [Micromonospora yangpuensis]